ncbi:CheY-like chemotaxis protein/HAMP domain-containing protein [Paenibacillus sp. PvR098]|nr:CheY-like chemotaxis protein/HAMP domain-containing protein [Paenibacillus sp. PvP091]MBP1170722.1 CheY-like chemotaxis protein/HAMP domain-containing protein [Paenibacillus sp. PvR098]MBP2441750.1 CheY-like chemotaxis protein/HAMP domain-containing protein [Paenibacillus sp. PvP052]
MLLVLFVVGGIGINRMNDSDFSMKEVYENRYKKVQLSTQIQNDASVLAKALADLVQLDLPESERQNIQIIHRTSELVSSQMQQMNTLFTDPTERALAVELRVKGSQFLEYKDQVLRMYETGNKTEADDLQRQTGNSLQEEFFLSMREIGDYQEEALNNEVSQVLDDNREAYMSTAVITSIGLLIGLGIMYWIAFSLNRGLDILSTMITNFANAKRAELSYRIPITTNDEFGRLAVVFNEMVDKIEQSAITERRLNKINEDSLWLQTEMSRVYYNLQQIDELEEIGEAFISELVRIVGAHDGALYVIKGSGAERKLDLMGVYARSESDADKQLEVGSGLIGQCAKDGQPISVEGYKGEYGKIRSSFGELQEMTLTIQPIKYDEQILGAFELTSLASFNEIEQKMIVQMAELFGILLNSIQGRIRIEELLRIHQALNDELQSQSEELLSQQDELKASNEKLEEQTRELKASEEALQRQQEELEQGNEALMNKTAELEVQIKETEEINRQVELAKESLERQALELALASRYKSEFLANMSHELRTPLNSLLILSQLLKENKEGRLSSKQVEYAETIYSSGCDLLRLIDDVLDLAKVESGRMEVNSEPVLLQEIADTLHKAFDPVALSKELQYEIRLGENLPASIQTDPSRLQQILKNLLSNAFKFTHSGGVVLEIRHAQKSELMLAFAVEDTGIGISSEKQEMIFEAFQQADGTTSRQYGGTGLGLSISRQLAFLLGGSLELESKEGSGSRFTLYLPMETVQSFEEFASAGIPAAAAAKETQSPAVDLQAHAAYDPKKSEVLTTGHHLSDDRDRIEEGDKVLLIIEDDAHFAAILLDMARSRNFKALVALQGDTGLQLAKRYRPHAILLDIQLPVIDGWSVLVKLKNDSETRHIPVHVISVVDEIHQGLSMGAIAWLKKPSSRENLEQAFAHIQSFLNRDLRNLLIVQPDEEHRGNLIELIAHDDISITGVSSGEAALAAISEQPFDCMVLDYGLTDMSVYELLDRIKVDEGLRRLPIIIYTGKTLDKKEQLRLKKYAESIIIKDVKSPERLLDETSLFLHRVEERLPDEKKLVLQKLHSFEAVFTGKKVLLVDDDIRNIFALSNLLEGLDMQVAFAETGKQALELLDREPDFDIVLMDIMMPVMDGYDAMRAIRADVRFDKLPIIALTAKAMKGDRDKCIQAGASDYITKPVHTEQLLSLMRVWLCK